MTNKSVRSKKNNSTEVNKYIVLISVLAVFLLSIPLTVFFAQQYKSKQAHAASTGAVSIIDFEFSPATLTVPVGTTVTWTNMSVSNSDHTTTSDVAGTANSWDSGLPNPVASSGLPDTFSFTFANAGTFTYHCNVHTFMHGTIIVTASTAPAPTATTVPVVTSAPTVAAPTAITPTLVCEGGNGTPPCATIPPTDTVPTGGTAPTITPILTLTPSGDGGSLNPITLILFLIELILKFLQSLIKG